MELDVVMVFGMIIRAGLGTTILIVVIFINRLSFVTIPLNAC